jgi:hypothetical protein
MAVSLAACCIILCLVYYVARGDQKEDEALSRVLAGIGKHGEPIKHQSRVPAASQRIMYDRLEAQETDSRDTTSTASDASAGRPVEAASDEPSGESPSEADEVRQNEEESIDDIDDIEDAAVEEEIVDVQPDVAPDIQQRSVTDERLDEDSSDDVTIGPEDSDARSAGEDNGEVLDAPAADFGPN